MTYVQTGISADVPDISKRLLKACKENRPAQTPSLAGLTDDELKRLRQLLNRGENVEIVWKNAKRLGFYGLVLGIFGIFGGAWRLFKAVNSESGLYEYIPDTEVDNRLARGIVAYEMMFRARPTFVPYLIELMPDLAFGTQEEIHSSIQRLLLQLQPTIDRHFFQSRLQPSLCQLILSKQSLQPSKIDTMKSILISLRDFGDHSALETLLQIGGGKSGGEYDKLRNLARECCHPLRERLNREIESNSLLRSSSPTENGNEVLLRPAFSPGSTPTNQLMRSANPPENLGDDFDVKS